MTDAKLMTDVDLIMVTRATRTNEATRSARTDELVLDLCTRLEAAHIEIERLKPFDRTTGPAKVPVMTNEELIAKALANCVPVDNMAQQAVTLKFFVRLLCGRLTAADVKLEEHERANWTTREFLNEAGLE